MQVNGNLFLQGKFRYDVYNENGELKKSVSGIKNFITTTGLGYAATYAFADLFRFISLGSGNASNSIIGLGTTGLDVYTDFSYIGSRSSYSDPSTSQYENPSCGYLESNGSVTLSRGWKIPKDADTFDGVYEFTEIMLTPGKPTGIAGLCGCGGGDIGGGGIDASVIADYYDSLATPSICNASGAFTRIVLDTPIEVNDRDYLVVNYDLTISFDNTVKDFNKFITNSFSSNWTGNVIGSYNILHHGLKLINNGNTIDESTARNQFAPGFSESYNWNNEYGESFIPLWGAPLEPSCLRNNLVAYFSTDNAQFLVNQISGGHLVTGAWKPYNPDGYEQSNALKAPIAQPSQTTSVRYFNMRTDSTGPVYPAQDDIFSDGSPSSNINYIFHSTYSKINLNLSNIPTTSRYGTVLHSTTFTNLNSVNWINGISPTPLVRSMVLNYTDVNASSAGFMYPFLDLLFTGTAGESILSTGDSGYTPANDNYFPLGNGGDLAISFLLSWTAPCPSEVVGCP
jgi:hypothetical protein